jgi:hypothetical protein
MLKFDLLDKQNRGYIPSLDGIRAIAIMLVFVAHAGWSYTVPGGFGVTVFFFLSVSDFSTALYCSNSFFRFGHYGRGSTQYACGSSIV